MTEITGKQMDAVTRGMNDPTLKAIIEFVQNMTAVTVGEATGFWTASTCDDMRTEHIAEFVEAMEKAGTDHEETKPNGDVVLKACPP
jgi:hypothetical protein